MDKQDFVWILQSALLHYDGMAEEELIKLGAKPELARAGIKLCGYLNKETLVENDHIKKKTKEGYNS
ncbi:hypothetical protein ES703_89072 [subsurface metagenome]